MFNRDSVRKHVTPHRRRPDDGNAFFPDPEGGPALAPDDLAEELAEEFLTSATSAEEVGEEAHEQIVQEEEGGPFIVSTGKQEFARGTDPSNPKDAERAAFPTVMGPSKRRGRL